MSTPASLQVGISLQAMSAVTFSVSLILSLSKTQSGLVLPAFQNETCSIGLFTVELTWLPTRAFATSPPPFSEMYLNFAPVACSSPTVMIWSSCLEPVPAMTNLPASALAASMYSGAVLYGESAFTQRTNSSSASIATGVASSQLNGMPVASGVVNRLDRVMMILWGLPLESFMSRKPSPPDPPPLLTTTSD